MRPLKQRLPHPDDLDIDQYLKFIHQVSADADPMSILLFGYMLKTDHQLIQAVEKHLSATGLSWAKFRFLLELFRHENAGNAEGMQPSTLSARQDISRNTASALIASLEHDGLISRALHGADRRKFVIRLTPVGRKMIRSKLDSEFKFVMTCFDFLSVAERQTLLDILKKLSQNLSKKEKTS